MSYSLFFEKQVLKYLSKIDKKDSKRIVVKVKELLNNPVPSDVKRLVNVKEKTFRLRIGDFRVLYRIEHCKLIVVFLIDKRSRVYKK